jgi:hypothetical protein
MINSLWKACSAKEKRIPAPTDEYYDDVSLLLHMDGANNSTTFTDDSSNNYSLTANGNAKISTTQSTFGSSSGYFDGSGDYASLNISGDSNFTFGTGDFTIEAFVYIVGNSPQASYHFGYTRDACIVGCFVDSANYPTGWVFGVSGDTTNTGTGIVFINYVNGTGHSLYASQTLSKNTWYYVAASRSGTTTRLFIDGVLKNSGTLANQSITGSNPLKVGRIGYYYNGISADGSFYGYIDELRVTKGIARYTSNYDTPDSPFPSS